VISRFAKLAYSYVREAGICNFEFLGRIKSIYDSYSSCGIFVTPLTDTVDIHALGRDHGLCDSDSIAYTCWTMSVHKWHTAHQVLIQCSVMRRARLLYDAQDKL